MQVYQYFILGTVDPATLHNMILQNQNLSPQLCYVQIIQGTNNSAQDGYYIYIYFNDILDNSDESNLTTIVNSYNS